MIGTEPTSCQDSQCDRRRHDQATVVVDAFSDQVHSAGSEEVPDLIVPGTVQTHELLSKQRKRTHDSTTVCSNFLHAAASAGAVSSTRRGLHAAQAPISEEA